MTNSWHLPVPLAVVERRHAVCSRRGDGSALGEEQPARTGFERAALSEAFMMGRSPKGAVLRLCDSSCGLESRDHIRA